jgi:hypothetical protein
MRTTLMIAAFAAAPTWVMAQPAVPATAPAATTPAAATAPHVEPATEGKRLTAKDGAVVAREWELGFSFYGLANGSFMTEPSDQDKVNPDNNQALLYPGFGGASGGAGFNLVGSWRGIIGLELGMYFSADRGTGSIQDFDFTVGQTAFHLPVLLRIAAPLNKGVRPFLFGGPDFVFPGKAEVTNSAEELDRVSVNGQPLQLNAHADSYMAWAAGFGLEFLLPLEGQDFRIPLTFRANLNPNTGVKAVDRLKAPVTQHSYDYNTEWEIQAVITLGFGWYFM